MPCKNIKYDLYNEIDIENGEELNIIVKRQKNNGNNQNDDNSSFNSLIFSLISLLS